MENIFTFIIIIIINLLIYIYIYIYIETGFNALNFIQDSQIKCQTTNHL